jgi:hypothetical protein
VEIVLPDPAPLWAERGFAVDADGCFTVGGIGLRAGGRELALHAPLKAAAAGLPIHADREPNGPADHPNGALAVDHLVVFTDDLAQTTRALQDAGADLRREAGRLNFLRVGPLILEVAQTGEAPRFWGLTFTVPELPAGDGYGEPRDAVQPGRRIVTARKGNAAVAFITPRP